MKKQYTKPTVEIIDLAYFEAVAQDSRDHYGLVATSTGGVTKDDVLSNKREEESASDQIWNSWGD